MGTRKIKLLAIGVLLGLVSIIGYNEVSYAAWSSNLQSTEQGSAGIKKGVTHEGSLYVTGEKIEIAGDVKGDVYCAGGEVVVSGTVSGDMLCAAQSVTITAEGVVSEDVRTAGQFVTIEGRVGGSLSAFGQDVTAREKSNIAGSVNGVAAKLMLDGSVGGQVVYATQRAEFRGIVEKNVDVSAGSIVFSEDAKIKGSLHYSVPTKQNIDKKYVDGAISYNETDQSSGSEKGGTLFSAMLTFVAVLLATSLAVTLVVPRFVHRSSELLRANPLHVVLTGFAVAIGLPLLSLLLMATIVFLPLGLVGLSLWFIASVLSGAVAAYYVGSVLLRGVDNILLRALGGGAVILIVYILPFINILAMFTVWIVGSGMVISTLTNGFQRPRYNLPEIFSRQSKKRAIR